MRRYFNDPDGDPLTFTAASSRVNVVTVGVAGSIVTLTPVDNGTATVTVTARDPGGLSATQTIVVTVRNTGGGWQRTGSGPAIVDLPTGITRIRIEGEYNGRGENFVVWCGIRLWRATGQRDPGNGVELDPVLRGAFRAAQLQRKR